MQHLPCSAASIADREPNLIAIRVTLLPDHVSMSTQSCSAVRCISSLEHRLTLQISQPLAPLVDEFAQRLFRELDYEAEGRNAEQFQRMYADVPRVRPASARNAHRVAWQAWTATSVLA